MKSALISLFFALRNFLAKRFLIAAGACFALGFIVAFPACAQVTYAISGTAGFETGLRQLASQIGTPVPSPDNSSSNVTVVWGDGSFSQGLIQSDGNGGYNVYGTHLYANPGQYQFHVQYTFSQCVSLILGICTNSQNVFEDFTNSATITPPGKFVILSIGDSIASGEGNPVMAAGRVNLLGDFLSNGNHPSFGFWDDTYSSGDPPNINTTQTVCIPFTTICATFTLPVSVPFPADESAEWPHQSFPCHRSRFAGPAQAANAIVASNPDSDITFIHYACSGAAIEAGDTASDWVQDAVGQLKIARERLAQLGAGIDILLISAGSNSLYGPSTFGNGFGGIVQYCLKQGQCDINTGLQVELGQSFQALPTYYQNLATEINCQQPPAFTGANGVTYQDPDPGCTDPQKQIPKLVLITEYMDPTHDENGNYPTNRLQCGPAFQFLDYESDGGDFKFFHDGVVVPLNNEVDSFPTYAQLAGLNVPTFAVTGIADAFRRHGVCAGDQRWVNDGQDSIALLGQGPPPIGTYPGLTGITLGNLTAFDTEELNGMLHPNSAPLVPLLLSGRAFQSNLACSPHCGQEEYAQDIQKAIEQHSVPVTTASATTGGAAYTFGTWATQDVVVTLSATSPLGVKQTVYGVDSGCTQDASGCSTYSGPFTISTPGQHTVTFGSVNALGVAEPFQSVQVWINASLTIAANNTTRQYGAAEPAFTVSYNGFQNGDTPSVLTGTLTCTSTDTLTSPVGTYSINCSGLSSPNYAITYMPGTLAVTQALLTVTVNNASRQYGQANPTFTGIIAGLQNGDNIIANYATSATPASPVGTYPISATLVDPGGKLGNYAVTLNNGTLAVTAAPLTITANNATRGYGQPNPPFGPSYSGFVNGENASVLAGTLICTSPATSSSPGAGSPYAISCSGLTSLNYAITYVTGALTVTAAPLTITANSATKILNAPLPAFGASYSGFVNGEGPSVLSGSLNCTTIATATSSVGSYPVTCSGLTAANYAIVWAAGTLKVMFAPAGVCGHVILPPIDPAGTTVGNQGRTIPAKFQVCDANGVSIGTPGVVTGFLLTQIITGTAAANVEDIVDTNNPDTAFRWDGTEWIFNITTQNLAAGSTYVYTIMLNDGSTIVFQFGLR